VATEAQLIITLRKLGYPHVDNKIGTLDITGLKAESFVSCAIGRFCSSDNAN